MWFAVEFRFLSPLLDLTRGSIPSPVCDIPRSPQPQGCPHLVLARHRPKPSRRSQFGRRARLTSGFLETVPPPRARKSAINNSRGAVAGTRYFRMLAAGSCRDSLCSISGYLHPLKINGCEDSALCPAGEGWSCGPGSGPAQIWPSCLRPDFLQSTWERPHGILAARYGGFKWSLNVHSELKIGLGWEGPHRPSHSTPKDTLHYPSPTSSLSRDAGAEQEFRG